MKNHNTLSKADYILYTLLYTFVCCVWYNNLFFRSFPDVPRFFSKCIFFAVVIVCLIANTAKTLRYDRNYVSVTVNVLLPLCLYSLCTYFSRLWLIALILAMCLCLVYCIIIMGRKVSDRRFFKLIMKNRVHRCYLSVRIIFTFAMTAAFTPVIISTIFGNSLYHSNVPVLLPSQGNVTVQENVDILQSLKPEKWINLTEPQKLDVLQTVANIEAQKLGLPHELTVTLKPLPENVAAYYNDNDHSITLNISSFDDGSSGSCLNSVCHEAYHAFQHRLCDLYTQSNDKLRSLSLFDSARHYINEFRSYSDGDSDYTSYYTQHCETDARDYAYDRTAEYFELIWNTEESVGESGKEGGGTYY